jgi:5-methylcytosine-specific restriction endonuclease McrA
MKIHYNKNMEFVLENYHRNTPDDELLDDVKKTALKINKNTITLSEYNEYGKYSSSTLTRRFGSWFKILELCELECSRSKLNISTDELFKNIENVWIILGRQPKYDEIKKPLSKYSAGTYDKRFGSWLKALELFINYIKEDNDNNCTTEEKEIEIIDKNTNYKHKTKREISDRLRFTIIMRDGFTCKKCGKSPSKELGVELHVDHIIPWSKGGETILENLETKCKKV